MTAYPGDLKAEQVDIAFIVESAYPYILGGVSTWVEQLMLHFPQYVFAVIFIGGAPEHYPEGIRYSMPSNLKHLQVHYLFDEDTLPKPKKGSSFIDNSKGFECVRKIHTAFRSCEEGATHAIGDLPLYEEKTGVSYEQFLYGEISWEFLKEQYRTQCPDISFIDYFWTVRNIHKPLWKLAQIVKTFPRAKLIHTASTGYAGLLSFLVHKARSYPVVLSEHGIYTRERRIDIFLSKNFRDDFVLDRPILQQSYLRGMWDRYFKIIAQLCYNIATPIVSLSSAARQVQLEEGASPEKTMIIPNGVDIARFKALRRPYEERASIVCFIGRLVPMKDVKGFIRAIPKVHAQFPEYKFWIIGSIDQDPKYAEECHALVENISMQHVVAFKLHQAMEEVLPHIRLLVLSAIREGMPFILLESFAAGIPVVATDSGACREMILGLSDDDKALGAAGCVVKVSDTSALEQAIIDVLSSQPLWEEMSASATARVERYYDKDSILNRYGDIYQQRMLSSWLE